MALRAALNATLAMNATMSGVVYNGSVPFQVTVEQVPVPTISSPTDAIIRITKSALCGSDLHIYRGFLPSQGVLGHEAIGYVHEVGDGVTSVSVGDYVVIPAAHEDGQLEMAPHAVEFFSGLQAEYALVPVADANLIPVPINSTTTNSTLEQDYLLVGDVWPTAWQALSWSNFEAGDSVAVWGAGPVGLLAAYSAKLRGASKIYVIDHLQDRLDRAAAMGATTINFVETDPVAKLLEYEPDGVMRSVELVGFEAVNANLEHEPSILLTQMIAATHLDGGIGLGGVWLHTGNTALSPNGGEIDGNFTFPYSQMFSNRLTIRGALVNPADTAGALVNLISSGVAHPAEIITTADVGIEQAPEYYARFNRWEEIKVFLSFP